jgi:UDP-N-acetylglucosamine--N-acetylmuramyl-(pentapeptide) pyrophosphoryl-undecaprenol N-acetylglucosamine transferase
MRPSTPGPLVAIACGGTGGHLFPGIAVAEEILPLGGRVLLLVSNQDLERETAGDFRGFETAGLPAVGLSRGNLPSFACGFVKSLGRCRKLFREKKPAAVLAMGGFTSAPPVLAGWAAGAKTYLHEANTLPGRANRWLAHFADEAFVFFDETPGRLNLQKVEVTGMPVRTQFQPMNAASARLALGLKPGPSVLLVMGGSQGASAVNDLACAAMPALAARFPDLQFIHLTGARDFEKVRAAYQALARKAVVRPFLSEMELALGAATLALSRSGASSLAELAAMAAPSILIPYPAATDNHQLFNALAFSERGAAVLLEQRTATASALAGRIIHLLSEPAALSRMREAMGARHQAGAAEFIARRILEALPRTAAPVPSGRKGGAEAFRLAEARSQTR